MKRICLLLTLWMILSIVQKISAQNIICHEYVSIALDQNCTATFTAEQALQTPPLPNFVVELDKTLPYGDGPWESSTLGPADVNQSYQYRVGQPTSGLFCSGTLDIQDKLPPVMHCKDVSIVDLIDGNPATMAATDLNLSAIDACGSVILAPTSFNYTCADLGVHIVQLTATDDSGNTATCQHTVLVNSTVSCQACVSSCPESVSVSYDEGNQVLFPAFQDNDWSVFDSYGNAVFDAACTSTDSTYIVVLQTGTAGQNWFTRRWIWQDGSGQLVPCKQTIVYPITHTVTVQGKLYLDNSNDCNPDAGESGVNYFPLVVTKQPSGQTQTIFPAADGTYSIAINFSVQDESAQVHLVLPTGVSSVCPSAIVVPNTSTTPLYNFDIGLNLEGTCALMQVDMAALNTRRCSSNAYTVQYCNAGLDTAYNAYVSIHLDSLISLESSTLTYMADTVDNTYIFQVGDMPPFHCGQFYITAFTSCDVVLGQTLCNEATAYPNTPCSGPAESVYITTTAVCTGDTVSLGIWNIGELDMTTPLGYIVVEDFIMYQDHPFQLMAGDSITIKVPANGATWRIEAGQSPDFPEARLSVAAIEGCGGLNTPGLINAFSQYDNQGYYDLDCFQATYSFDPNDKSAVPTGYNEEHFIRANEQIEYQIRFQNTGTDTAFRVEIVDTLSTLLDPLSLKVGASSHPYKLDIYPGGIIHFVFDPIALPDSNANEAASHGLVQYRIAQKPDLPDGSVIENTAAIYFDDNAPVYTNTTFHTIGYPFLTVSSWAPYTPGVAVSITPNPFRDQAVLTVEGKQLSQGRVSLYDLHGRLLQTSEMTNNQTVLHRGTLPPGVYFFQITENGVGVGSGKIQVN